jgi:predicted RNase H-like HicB family nuclease
MAGPFNVVLFYPGNPTPHVYWRDSERRMPDGGLAPQFSPNPQDAKFKRFHRAEDAVARRDLFRKYFPGYRIEIWRTDGSTEPQFEDRNADVSRREAPADDRVPHHSVVAGIDVLISPGSDKYWWVRFPGSGIESLRGATPDEAVQKYAEAVALYPHIAQHVERYVEAEITNEQFAAQIQNAQDAIRRAQFGPGRRRPGNH